MFADGSYGFGLELEPIDVSCWADEDINEFSNREKTFLNSLPSNIDIQLVQDITSENKDRIPKHQSDGVDDEVSKALVSERTKRLLKEDQDGLIPNNSLKLFVRRPGGSLIEKPSLFSKTREFENIGEDAFSREVGLTVRLRDDTSHQLESLGLRARPIPAESILSLTYGQWNPGRSLPLGHYDPENIRDGLLFTDVSLYERGFSLSDSHYRVVSLKLLPDQTFSAMAQALKYLPFGSRLFLNIHVPDQQKELSLLQTQRRLAFSMARGKREGVSDMESEAKFQDVEQLLEDMISQGEKVFQVSLNVVLKSKDESDLEDQVTQTLSQIRDLSGAEAMEESLAAFDIFSQTAIPNAREKERKKRLKTSTLADLLPIFAPWKGHDKSAILLRSRDRSLVTFDPFDSSLTNYNQIVSGGSGSGKSFLTNILLLQMLKDSPKIFIVDIGGSYKKLCDNLSGQYIPFGHTSKLSINPFDLNEGETRPSNEKIKFLVGLVEMMTKEDHDRRLPRLERAEIEEAIQSCYEITDKPRLSTLQKILLAHQDVTIKRFGRILGPWCGETPFGAFLDRPTNVGLNSRIVSFDLKDMDADLQSVGLYIITDYIWRQVQADRKTMKFLVFDECWKLLENEAGSSFIAEVFRTFRKYYASAIAISQNIDDFAKSKVSGAILSNSAIKWILMQKGADRKRLQEVLQLNENEMTLVSSLSQKRGEYSEAFLMAQDNKSVVSIESTPLEYWIATTDPRDLGALENELTGSQESNLAVLKKMAQRFPHGITAGMEQP